MRIVTGKDFVKVLEKQGWTLARIRGSHYVFKKPGEFATLSVPVHGNTPLKIGLLADLLKQAGLTENDLPGGPRTNETARDDAAGREDEG